MLKELYIDNLAVIKNANISFNNNLNIFTGETGAGKSILINGINAILGQRTTKDIVRNGCQKAVVVALFTDVSPITIEKLKMFGYDCENFELTISREISCDGGSVARINSRPATINVLKEIGETLINIHGQHDNQILLNPDNHLEVLDSFAEISDFLKDYQQSFRELQQIAREIKKLVINDNIKNARILEIKEFLNETTALNIEENEDEIVENKFFIATNSKELSDNLHTAKEALGGNDTENGAISLCELCFSNLDEYSEKMPQISELANRIKAINLELDDINSEILNLIEKIDIDPKEFTELSDRFDILTKIKKKYGPSLQDVLTKINREVQDLEVLENSEFELEKLTKLKNDKLTEVTEKAEKLTLLRKNASLKFTQQVAGELEFLNMTNVKLEVQMTKGKLTINGMDNVEFLISANIGEPPKPISKIASGGELSRIMLSLKNVLANKDNIPTLIFDEIDTGVSGIAAQKIGIKLSQISKFRQVLCVTHLSQIAVMADNHLFIEKTVIDNTTVTNVRSLSFEERKYEIARILGGNQITNLLLENAEQLINSSKKLV